MPDESDGDEDVVVLPARKRKFLAKDNSGGESADKYKPYIKPHYKRIYGENSEHSDYTVFVESTRGEVKMGNTDPVTLQKLLSQHIKGQHEISRVNAHKIQIIFKQANAANDFINSEIFLERNSLKAYIPASYVERIGVIQYVSTELSNEDLYRKLSCEYEIIAVRRFTKKGEDGSRYPLTTISVTFVTNNLPQFVYIDRWRSKVKEYIYPVMQCYKCLKFNHTAKICKNKQVCSKCAGEHSHKDCVSDDMNIKCSNCGGAHLAISKLCPIKQAKVKASYAKVTARPVILNDKNFPVLSKPKSAVTNQDVSNKSVDKIDDKIVNAMVKALLILGNSDVPKTRQKIKELILENLNG